MVKYVWVLLEHRVECFLNSLLFPLYDVVWLQKEEVETALRSSNMILEDALDLLNMSNNWRGRHNDLEPPFEHMNPPFPTQRFNPQQIPFAPPVSTEPPSRSLLSLSLSLSFSVSPSLSISAFRFWVFRGWFLPSTVVKLMIWCVVWIWSLYFIKLGTFFFVQIGIIHLPNTIVKKWSGIVMIIACCLFLILLPTKPI